MDNTSFVERIRWSKKTYVLRMLLEFRRPPCIVLVPKGHKGFNEIENIPAGLVMRIHSVFTERRVFARGVDGRVWSIPESFPIKFEVVKKNKKRSKARRLDEILRNYRPPIVVALDRRNNRWNFRNGKAVQSEESLGTLVLFKAYFEHFARVNPLRDGAIDRSVFLIPLYMDVDVLYAEGLKNGNTSDYTNLMNMYGSAVGSVDYSTFTGLNAILVFDPSVGSSHPLALSDRLPSRSYSAPGGNSLDVSRAATEDPTTTATNTIEVRSSEASGSLRGRGRTRSEGNQRGIRSSSEELVGTLTLEREGPRVATVTAENNRHGSTTDDSVLGATSGRGRYHKRTNEADDHGKATLNRRKGRSTEELQTRSKRKNSAEKLESISLDRRTDVSRTKTDREDGVEKGQGHQGGTKKTDVSRTDGGGGDVKRQNGNTSVVVTRADVTQTKTNREKEAKVNNAGARRGGADGAPGNGAKITAPLDDIERRLRDREHAANGIEASNDSTRNRSKSRKRDDPSGHRRKEDDRPTPKPRPSRLDTKSEDDDDDNSAAEHLKVAKVTTINGYGMDHSRATHGRVTSPSPAAHYHININIKSPKSPPWQLNHHHNHHQQRQDDDDFETTDLEIHSLARPQGGANAYIYSPFSSRPPIGGFPAILPPGGPRLPPGGSRLPPGRSNLPPGGSRAARKKRNQPRKPFTSTGEYIDPEMLPFMLNRLDFGRQNSQNHVFVTAITCGGGSDGPIQVKDIPNQNRRINSKVIRLSDTEEEELFQRQTRKNQWMGNSVGRWPGDPIIPFSESLDENNNRVTGTGTSGKYHHAFLGPVPNGGSSSTASKRLPFSNNRSIANVRVSQSPNWEEGKRRDGRTGTGGETSGEEGGGAGRRPRWVLRGVHQQNYHQHPQQQQQHHHGQRKTSVGYIGTVISVD